MSNKVPLIDASVFLGMHHEEEAVRLASLAFFRHHFNGNVVMNYEQVGICDAVIWQQSRAIQDAYYPFMDLLHSIMRIRRIGYQTEELKYAATQLADMPLASHKKLLIAQTLVGNFQLYTHDKDLIQCSELHSHLATFPSLDAKAEGFAQTLDELYETSRAYKHTLKDWKHVTTGYLYSSDHAA